jgi:hypothetical protein
LNLEAGRRYRRTIDNGLVNVHTVRERFCSYREILARRGWLWWIGEGNGAVKQDYPRQHEPQHHLANLSLELDTHAFSSFWRKLSHPECSVSSVASTFNTFASAISRRNPVDFNLAESPAAIQKVFEDARPVRKRNNTFEHSNHKLFFLSIDLLRLPRTSSTRMTSLHDT